MSQELIAGKCSGACEMRREMDFFSKFPPPVVIYLPVIGLTVFKDIPFCRYVIEIGIPFLAFAPVRILRVFVYCSEVGKIYVTIVRLLESLSIEYRLIKTKVITVAKQNKDKYCMEPIALKRGKTLVTNSQLAFISFISHWLQGCLEFWRPTTERSETKPKNHGLLSALNRSFHQRLLHFPLGAREPLLTFPKGGLSFHSLRAVSPFRWNPSPCLKESAEKKYTLLAHCAKLWEWDSQMGPANANINFSPGWFFFLSFLRGGICRKGGTARGLLFSVWCGTKLFIIISFQVFLQLLILLTGNYNFFNLLTIVLCISLLDDKCILSRMQCFLCRRCMRSSCCHAASQRK